jgi:hypothetical protein
VEQALLHQNVSLHGAPHLYEEGHMHFAPLQHFYTPENSKSFDS